MRARASIAAICVVLAACTASGGGSDASKGGSTTTGGPKTTTTSGGAGTTTTEKAATTTTSGGGGGGGGSGTTSKYVHVEGSIDIPEGGDGTLDIVLIGKPNGSEVPVVIRNDTDEALQDLTVSGTARDSGGALIGSGSADDLVPSIIQPGEWGFGSVSFGAADLPADAGFDLEAQGSPFDPTDIGDVDLETKEVRQTTGENGGQIVGILENTSDAKVLGPISVLAICFDGDEPVATVSGYTDIDDVEAGGTTPFSLDLFDTACPAFAIGGSGYNF
jgi:hypothetical protein